MNLYGIQNRSTIDSWNTTMARDNAIERDNLLRGYERVAISTVTGYIDVGYMVLCPYSGRYGEGFVVCSSNINPYTGKASSKFMDIEYWIKKED